MCLFFAFSCCSQQQDIHTLFLTYFPPQTDGCFDVFVLIIPSSLRADEKNPLSQTMPDKPTELRHFAKLCEQRRKFPILYKLEFQTAVKVETNSCKHALRKANALKNQNPKCIPYDYNRVVLDKYDNTPDSDYINASYVDVSKLLALALSLRFRHNRLCVCVFFFLHSLPPHRVYLSQTRIS